MAFVVDASVTMAWCFEDEATPYTDGVLDRLRTTRAVVPALWPLEVANVLLVAERRGKLTEARTAHFTQMLKALPIAVEESTAGLGAILAIGREHGLTAYDAAYLELAAREGLSLATQDKMLKSAALRLGVDLVT